ncbi:CPBP family intramembrane metalloprotease [candidate division WOR-3 bacterium]|nr:CPBP family intramembrane metalloprotease [candidate division WOR-3 bacterium]
MRKTSAKTLKILKTVLYYFLVFCSYILFTYTGYDISLIGSFLIIGLTLLFWQKKWAYKLGLKLKFTDLVVFIVIFLLVFISSYFIIMSICHQKDLLFNRKISIHFSIIQTIGQTFNEELVYGALLFLPIIRRFPKKYSISASLIMAVVFALFHLLFYRICIGQNRGYLSFLTIFNLFLAGFIRNNLIIYSGHIYWAWALHLAWNMLFFGYYIVHGFNEPELFNNFVGTIQMLVFLGGLSIISFILINSQSKRMLSEHQ